jgi:hypothetical protein
LGNSHFFISSGFSEDFGVQLMRARSFRHLNVTLVNAFLRQSSDPPEASVRQPNRSELAGIHPALRFGNSFTLHRFATDKRFTEWKGQFFDRFGSIRSLDEQSDFDRMSALFFLKQNSIKVGTSVIEFVPSQRRAPSLFGAGLINRVPDKVLEEVAQEQARAAAEQASGTKKRISPSVVDCFNLTEPKPISGHVARLRGGRAGHFGWKAQTATLREFTLQACGIELGLEVPGVGQAAPPWITDYKAPGLDLTKEQCDALVSFVESLPPPAPRKPENGQHAAEIAAGQKLFMQIGCAVCHRPSLGDVQGIYSDLLLHDMGESLAGRGVYGVETTIAGRESGDQVDPLPVITGSTAKQDDTRPRFGAAPGEWRTPALWGVRDSGPYLHDGRADTLDAAIRLHDGAGLAAAQRFVQLSFREREEVELFLEALPLPAR